jgi:hypothetical protein
MAYIVLAPSSRGTQIRRATSTDEGPSGLSSGFWLPMNW